MSKKIIKKKIVESVQNNPKNEKSNIKNPKKIFCVVKKLKFFLAWVKIDI